MYTVSILVRNLELLLQQNSNIVTKKETDGTIPPVSLYIKYFVQKNIIISDEI